MALSAVCLRRDGGQKGDGGCQMGAVVEIGAALSCSEHGDAGVGGSRAAACASNACASI